MVKKGGSEFLTAGATWVCHLEERERERMKPGRWAMVKRRGYEFLTVLAIPLTAGATWVCHYPHLGLAAVLCSARDALPSYEAPQGGIKALL